MSLEVDGVSRLFGGVRALDSVSFSVQDGSIHGLIGPNGAGKTTLINVLSGLMPPTGGTVQYRGRTIHLMRAHEVAALGVARTFQNIRLFPGLTCLENVLAGQHLVARRPVLGTLLGLRSARQEQQTLMAQARNTLSRVGLSDRADSLAQSLSYGERRRLEIARALASNPRLLLLDEPVAGMRAAEAEQVSELIRSLAGEGITVLLIEHNMGFVMGLCSRITVLNFGRTVTTGTPAEVGRHPEVIEAYLGKDENA